MQGPDKQEFRLENLDVVLMATGRHPNTKNIGLEKVRPVCDRLELPMKHTLHANATWHAEATKRAASSMRCHKG